MRFSECMEAYKNWVRRNKDHVHSLESLANGLTWLLPERFSSSEIGPEAVTSILGILTAINQHIIDTTPLQWPQASVLPSSFPYWLFVSAFKELETLVEVIAQQFYGDHKKWNFIAVAEASKVLLRLALFRASGYKMLLHGGEIPNTGYGSPPGPPNRLGHLANPPGAPPGYSNTSYYRQNSGSLEGRALSALSMLGENARTVYDSTWINRTPHHNSIVDHPTLVADRPTVSSMLSEKGLQGSLFVMGEMLFILRPLIYVLFIRKYGTKSWIPWFVSLAVDFIGMGALSQATKPQQEAKELEQIHLSSVEKDELSRRKVLWALYVMRDPFFCKYIRQRLESTQKALEPVPLMGLLAEKIIELILGAQTRYTYMSGS
ncbi:hypothetical protein Nepgr_024339 [Nepenthes gracilis]|uniref:Peroxisomal membrane protein PEX16 n=1 Tax=Nepenthes gracilis TaxID=150966 RepID=A0AAD3T4H5_NEPGR|nr:hypothetical protein Nepgr_024339 [Nepenthes gracilis]